MPRDAENRQFEEREQRADHFARVHFAGCPNCGYAVDITIPTMRHADSILSVLYHLAGDASPDELKDAIASMRGWNDEITTWQILEDAEFIELKNLWDRVAERKHAAPPTVPKARKKKR